MFRVRSGPAPTVVGRACTELGKLASGFFGSCNLGRDACFQGGGYGGGYGGGGFSGNNGGSFPAWCTLFAEHKAGLVFGLPCK